MTFCVTVNCTETSPTTKIIIIILVNIESKHSGICGWLDIFQGQASGQKTLEMTVFGKSCHGFCLQKSRFFQGLFIYW